MIEVVIILQLITIGLASLPLWYKVPEPVKTATIPFATQIIHCKSCNKRVALYNQDQICANCART